MMASPVSAAGRCSTTARRCSRCILFDFDDDLYGQTIDVAFIGWIRQEQKFESIETLKRHMTADAAQARDALRRAGKAFPRLGDI